MQVLFKVPRDKILEAIAQMNDGTIHVWREATEVVRVKGPVDNILHRINHMGKVGIEPTNISSIVSEEDLPDL